MKIIKVNKANTKQSIQEAITVLRAGGLIIYPTETCYGIGVDATNPKAVAKLLKYKRRPEGKAISIAVVDRKMAKKYVTTNETADNIYENLLPGPITVISSSLGNTAHQLEAENHTIGIRIPNYSFTLELIKQFGKPITATSANSSGKKTPYEIQDILSNISKKQSDLIALILDRGKLANNPPSTVVDTTLSNLPTLRQGQIEIEQPNKSIITKSEHETRALGNKLIQKHKSTLDKKCIIVALQGDLGAGKTQFTKGIAKGLGIKQVITSPTYLLVKEYIIQNTNKLYHIDTWRTSEETELDQLGLQDMLKIGNVIAIEWIEKAEQTLGKLAKNNDIKIIWVTIEHQEKQKREIKVKVFE